ncbi:MAG: response regulator [Pirellulales bacterium]|nr:response regulator [Pirellulales bacterium]
MINPKVSGKPSVTLLVEDDLCHAQLIMHGLQKHHLDNVVYHVWDGEEALDYLFRRGKYVNREMSPRPDVVLLDLRMPKVDGLEVLKEVKESERLRGIPIIILTSSEAEVDLAQAYEYRANSYLVKPLDLKGFGQLMNTLTGYWLRCDHHPELSTQNEAAS